MTNKRSPIDEAVAKKELERINDVLESPLIIIGGLAVQQYHVARRSKDIDLICDFNTSREIIRKIYPSVDWDVEDHENDEYRPSLYIKHRVENKGTIIFGPKILERAPYEYIDWNVIGEGAKPFRSQNGKELRNILVPLPHMLAYTKLIPFLGRKDESKKKQDLQDFSDLTNHNKFILSEFDILLRRSGNEEELKNHFSKEAKNYSEIIKGSVLLPLILSAWNDDTKYSELMSGHKGRVMYYLYISDQKVNMLLSQLPFSFKEKMATELEINIAALEEDRFSRLALASEYIKAMEDIGTLDSPKAWVADTQEVSIAHFGENDNLVAFIGSTQDSNFLLGGSAAHLIATSRGRKISTGWSFMYDLLHSLRVGLNMADNTRNLSNETLQRAISSNFEKDSEEWYELVKVAQEFVSKEPKVKVEFLARKLLERKQTLKGAPDSLLATPLYIAMVD